VYVTDLQPFAMSVSAGPLFAYRALRAQGKLAGDPDQELAAEKLQALFARLRQYKPQAGMSWIERLGWGQADEAPTQGLYLYGGVGRGKSMLMDLFFAAAPVRRKRRVHFHAFMQEVHGEIHRWRALAEEDRGGDDPLKFQAKRIAAQATLLCFDEFQVEDVADAMILRRLFAKLFQYGVVVVITSNLPPDELYAEGLNRPLFLPFIELLKTRLDLLHLSGATDHRSGRLRTRTLWHAPLGPKADAAIEADFAALTDGAPAAPLDLDVQGRALRVPAQALGVARFTFAELCADNLGAADYLELARRFRCVVIAGIPLMGPERRNEAKRFLTLIDALYEAKVKLVASAAGPPEALYAQGDGAEAFQRTASRLKEMQSAEYLALPHAG
jgi:cell division protein ZapE